MRILCVDDDRLVLAITADLIRSMGHDVIEAQGGRDAARAIRDAAPIDVMITDIHMPGGPGGIELAQWAREFRPELKIIFFSGIAEPDMVHEHAMLLRKPCTLRELRQAIASVMH